MKEYNITIKDFDNMGFNTDALHHWNQGIYTKEELLEMFYNNQKPMYTEGDLIPKDWEKKIIKR